MYEFFIAPSGRPALAESSAPEAATIALPKPLAAAFELGTAPALLHLATAELQAHLPPPIEALRSFACAYLTRLCQTQGHESTSELPATPPLSDAEFSAWIDRAPPMTGAEYLRPETLAGWWAELDALVRGEIKKHPGGAQSYLREKNPLWRFVGRVTLHLAENKRDEHHPFAFLATYVSRLSPQGRVQHEPLSRALQQYAGEGNRQALLSLLVPLDRAAERSTLIKDLVESGDIYHALAWTPREAHRFLRDIPAFEESGLLVRVPDWWKPNHPARAVVNVRIDSKRGPSLVGKDAMLEFSLAAALEGEELSADELEEMLAATEGLVRLKGKWVEIDREKLAEALEHWRGVEKRVRREGLTFFEGMRLLAGASLDRGEAADVPPGAREWTGLNAGPELQAMLDRLGSPDARQVAVPGTLRAELRPYQKGGLGWLHFVTRLGLGACLADDMGLGKTVQVIALLLAIKGEKKLPSLLVVPASLIANWKAEIERFAPALRFAIAHKSEASAVDLETADLSNYDLVITTYGMLVRQEWLREREWNLAILDEAQAIKNTGTRQTRAAKEVKAAGRIAMTGTPIENRLSDLWSLFDFLNPGLLGSAKAFGRFVKELAASSEKSYKPLRSLVGPYILRRLKTDKNVIADLPDKTEVKAYCGLTKQQAVLYERVVRDLENMLETAAGDDMQRRGLVLAQLMRFKQICNHPSQLLGHGEYDPKHSGKFQRLGDICEEIADRHEKVLVFTQFREITDPLARFLEGIFGRPGLVLHGGVAVKKRRELVESFQRDSGPPFFVLSVKAGGTGLNLTAASQVIHFDRWWNPAVEDQATDRAFRIGQKRNVLVHKFVCRGTVEERIDAMITQKSDLMRDVVEGGERLLTEMPNDELLRFVALDVTRAMESE